MESIVLKKYYKTKEKLSLEGNQKRIILVQSGNFYLAFYEDARVIGNVFAYRVKEDYYSCKGCLNTGFPKVALNKVIEGLSNEGYTVELISDGNKTEEVDKKTIKEYSKKIKGRGYYRKPEYSEMSVITRSKQLMFLIYKATQDSPKKFRFSLTASLQALAMEITEKIYLANETYVDLKLLADIDRTIDGLTKKRDSLNGEVSILNENKLFTLKLTKAQKIDEKITMRRNYQFGALTTLKQLDALIVLAREMQCITKKEHKNIAIAMNDVKNLLGGWINSDKKKYG